MDNTLNKEFNPTSRDLITLDTLILEIKSKKNKLIASKISFQNSLSALKDKYDGIKFKSPEFDKIKNERQEIKGHLHTMELQIKSLNDELNFKNKLRLEVEYHIKNNKSPNGDVDKIINKLLALKNKYSDFAKDRTRIASLRVVASEITDELESIIKNI